MHWRRLMALYIFGILDMEDDNVVSLQAAWPCLSFNSKDYIIHHGTCGRRSLCSKKPVRLPAAAGPSEPPTSPAPQPPTSRSQLALLAAPSALLDFPASYSWVENPPHMSAKARLPDDPDSWEMEPSAEDRDPHAHCLSSVHKLVVGLRCNRHLYPNCGKRVALLQSVERYSHPPGRHLQ